VWLSCNRLICDCCCSRVSSIYHEHGNENMNEVGMCCLTEKRRAASALSGTARNTLIKTCVFTVMGLFASLKDYSAHHRDLDRCPHIGLDRERLISQGHTCLYGDMKANSEQEQFN
jgi:hypothetical protein